MVSAPGSSPRTARWCRWRRFSFLSAAALPFTPGPRRPSGPSTQSPSSRDSGCAKARNGKGCPAPSAGLRCTAQRGSIAMEGRPRRSVLYMPGCNERALEKAKTLPADALILDLEDAVAPDEKIRARQQVCAVVKGGGYGAREVVIRVNALETPWG